MSTNNKFLILEIPNDKPIILNGSAIGKLDKEFSGEVVFQTGMVGYPEALTDPSYKKQILVLTYPIIGSYGVPDKLDLLESDNIQVGGLIIGECVEKPSHHWQNQEPKRTFQDWLKEEDIPGMEGVDTRQLTKLIREHGTLIGHIVNNLADIEELGQENGLNYEPPMRQLPLVSQVNLSRKDDFYKIYNEGGSPKVLVIDCGMKRSQLNAFLNRGAEVKVVGFEHHFVSSDYEYNFERLFISNGPGDPQDCRVLIDQLRVFIKTERAKDIPILGICYGHQILGLAAGATSYKMKYGNRGHNIPCKLVGSSERCVITSQNHGYAIDTEELVKGGEWQDLFINANDGSNEGIRHTSLPYYSVQFHPEAKAGPEDTGFIFDLFLENRMENIYDVLNPNKIGKLERPQKKKLLIIGSGGLSIGQSGEFDYSGSQAIKAFKEEGLQIILINPNVATVQTTPGFADKVYYLPVKPEYILKVIKLERPDCVTLSFGGQTALNCGVQLYKDGIFEKYNIEILGSPIESVILTEDRERFKQHLNTIGEETIPSYTARSVDEAYQVLKNLEFPVLVRASFALGGLGSGFAQNMDDFKILVNKAFSYSEQVIIDKSLKGWKEVEYEVVRDAYDNCICVCNMENLDPLGVHTGESIVVAPSQTLNDNEYHKLRTTAIKTIRSLGIVGECNIQYALDTESDKYYIVEVNARLSRSSALASKATGYPLAYVAAKLALNYSLTELRNSLTKNTTACFEPSLDYLVVKVPRWDLAKFPKANRTLDSSMKSIGEAMAIGRTFEEAFQKGLRMANDGVLGFEPEQVEADREHLELPTYQRIFAIATALYEKKYTLEQIYNMTKIDYWFLYKMERIINYQQKVEAERYQMDNKMNPNIILNGKKLGFSDKQIGKFIGTTELVVRRFRKDNRITPFIKRIDTVAAEFPCSTNYLYSTYSADSHDLNFDNRTGIDSKSAVIVLGSGVYKIGSSVEFDWCAVNCLKELRRNGERVVMINCNPETVSTDYDEADTLYFDELSFETVMDIYELENPKGIILSVGGQIPNNIAMSLRRQKVNVFGTSPDNIDTAENRYKFSRLLDQIGIDQPKWKELISMEEAKRFCQEVTYPCLVRPSYVLSGQAMNIAYNDEDLVSYLENATRVSKDFPIVISKFIEDAKEIEVDAVAEKGQLKIVAISEHVENAGVHSGDATLIFPPQGLTEITMERIKDSTLKIAKALNINGPFNIQFIAKDNELKVIECNLRVSRTFPFVSKTMGFNMIEIATQVMMGLPTISVPEKIKTNRIGVKVPMFSFSRLKGADIALGVEMVSTGEVACFGSSVEDAYLKGIQASDVRIPKKNGNILLSIGSYRMKDEFLDSAKSLEKNGYQLFGTVGTFDFYESNGVNIKLLSMDQIINKINDKDIDLVINISNKLRLQLGNGNLESDGYQMRRQAIDNKIPLITNIKNGKLYVKSLNYLNQMDNQIWLEPKTDCFTSYKTIRLPGMIDVHVHLREPGQPYKEDWETCTKAALAGGVTMIGVMPNTTPAITEHDTQNMIKKIAREKAHCDYGVYLGATADNHELWKENKDGLVDKAMALKMYLNNTFGPLLLDDTQIWLKHLKNWPKHRPICVHAEQQTMASILFLAQLSGGRHIHVCHVARKEEILLIKACKDKNMSVSCEVAPHHLFLTELNELGENLSAVKPPLASQEDQESLWENLDVIDCFATDHAPHTKNDKECSKCPGFPGLETALPLLLTAVAQGRMKLDDLVLRYHTNPKKIFGLPEQEDTYIEVDMEHKWILPDKLPYTKCGWSPFAGMKVQGLVRRVVLRGKSVYVDGEILSNKGFGRDIREEYNVSNKDMSCMKASDSKFLELMIPDNNEKRMEEKRIDKVKINNLLSVEQLDRKFLRELFHLSDDMEKLVKEKGVLDILKNKVMASVFYEPSTRTRCSFNVAMQRLGGRVVEVGEEGSSVKKGESFSDFIKTMESYSDIIVVRSSQKDIQKALPDELSVPVINAGDGAGEHPTQALLDIYTMRKEKGTVTGKTIALVGDLKHGRTAHSLAKLLTLYQNVRLIYISADNLRMPKEVKDYVEKRGLEQLETDNLEEYLPKIDILYMTRLQKERLEEEVEEYYHIDSTTLVKAKEDLVILHPLPRVDEISRELDSDPRSAYFRQMENGMYVRMALLKMICQ